jgi:hypothetical protein
MDIQGLMRLAAQGGKQFVPFDEAQRRRQMEFDRRFPNADKSQPYSVYLDDIFGPDEYIETYDEYLRRTGQPSQRESMRDFVMGGSGANTRMDMNRMPMMQPGGITTEAEYQMFQRMMRGMAPSPMPSMPDPRSKGMGILKLLGGMK